MNEAERSGSCKSPKEAANSAVSVSPSTMKSRKSTGPFLRMAAIASSSPS